MKIRRFHGRTSREALRQVKAALGPEAVILETTQDGAYVVVTAATDEPVIRANEDGELVREVRQLMKLMHEVVATQWREGGLKIASELVPLHRGLVAQGVDPIIATELLRETAAHVTVDTSLDAALEQLLDGVTSAPVARVRLFVGPPGDGKTTTIMKLAAQERHAGRRVALISCDTYRVGGAAELAAAGRALGAPVVAAADAAALARALSQLTDVDTVLVDTAGVASERDPAFGELTAFSSAAGPEASRTLVLSATTGSVAVAETWKTFAALSPDDLALTKLDVAPGGPILGLCWRRHVPVSLVTTGRRIPQDLEPATPSRLARCLLAA